MAGPGHLPEVSLPSRRVLKAFDRRRLAGKDNGGDHHSERPFWGPHPDRRIAAIEAEFYGVGRDFLRAVCAAAMGRPAPGVRALEKAFQVDPGEMDGWGRLVDLFSRKIEPAKLMDGWTAVVDRLVAGLLPQATVEAAASRMAMQTHLMWRIGQRVAAGTLPTWDDAVKLVPSVQAESMVWARNHGMAYLQNLSDESRKAMRTILVQSREYEQGAQGLNRALFDKMSGLNRDWRRIAITETALAVGNGQLSSAAAAGVPQVARWVASPLACKHCLAQQGKVFAILAAPDPARGDDALWPGKNNLHRSAYRWSRKESRYRDRDEMWWPCIPMHPLCCCSLVVQPAPPGGSR